MTVGNCVRRMLQVTRYFFVENDKDAMTYGSL